MRITARTTKEISTHTVFVQVSKQVLNKLCGLFPEEHIELVEARRVQLIPALVRGQERNNILAEHRGIRRRSVMGDGVNVCVRACETWIGCCNKRKSRLRARPFAHTKKQGKMKAADFALVQNRAKASRGIDEPAIRNNCMTDPPTCHGKAPSAWRWAAREWAVQKHESRSRKREETAKWKREMGGEG